MQVSHSGEVVDCKVDPVGGAKLCLQASLVSKSKNKAWSWATDAVDALSFYNKTLSENLKLILHDTRTNFPASEEGLVFVESLPPMPPPKKIRIKNCMAHGRITPLFDNLKPDTEHEVVTPPVGESEYDKIGVVWVMGMGGAVRIMSNEYVVVE